MEKEKLFNIAFESNRKDTTCENKQLTWEEFKEFFKETERTSETVEEYKNMTQEEQVEIKDVGGFICGYIKDNKRNKENVVNRSMITLDMDHKPFNVWDTITLFFDYKCLMYSTHKHTPEEPRLRLIIPLDRDVEPEEYEPISRTIAKEIDDSMEIFDNTTYEFSRLMFSPSTPCDGEYVFEYQDGELLKADEILNSYTFGWDNPEYWPRSKSEVSKRMKKTGDKVQDPTTKTGYIGAFCRAYTIHEAIETFLSDVYEPGSKEDRYKYTKSDSADGLEVFDDGLTAYSYQESDKVSGKGSVNSFDLVRLHLFGDLDSDEDLLNLESKDLKSFKAMCEFVCKDKKANAELIKEEFEKVTESLDSEEKIKATKSYILKSKNGLKVNTGLLAKFIRENSNYMLVRKKGYENDFLYWYEKGVYSRISSNELKGRIKAYIPEKIRVPNQWENVYKELITDIKCIDFEELDIDRDYINLKNGMYNIKTNKLEEHNANIKSTVQINCNYDINATEPIEWIKFIDKLSDNDKEIKLILQEWFGVVISNLDIGRLKKCLALYGEVGNTGKTQYNNMLIYMLGLNNIASVPIQLLNKNFALGDLYGKRALIVDDQSSINFEDSSNFKALTGGGVVRCEPKNKQAFPFIYHGSITFACNDLPYIKDDKGDHVFNRIILIPCRNVIPPEERDNNIIEKFKKEVDGIFLWALEGVKRFINNDFKFTNSVKSDAALEDYRSMNDSLYRFIKEKANITNNKKDRVKKTDFEYAYILWVSKEEISGLEKKNIKPRMLKYGIPTVMHCGVVCYTGILLKDDI